MNWFVQMLFLYLFLIIDHKCMVKARNQIVRLVTGMMGA